MMQDLIVYCLYRFLGIVVNLVPQSWAYWLGKRLGDLIHTVFKDRSRIAIKNMKLALDVDDPRAEELAKDNFQHLGMILIEFLRLPQLKKEDLDQILEIEGLEYLEEVIEKGQGFVIFSGHFGNWELLGAILALKGYPVNALARNQSNELINEHILEMRAAKGINIFNNRGMAIRNAYRALQRGEGLFVLGDQKTTDAEHFVEFFGVKAAVKLGAVNLAARTNSKIIPTYIARQTEGKHKIIIKEPLTVESEPTVEEKKDIFKELNSTLEDVIREYPDQWLWPHKRWKYSPDLK